MIIDKFWNFFQEIHTLSGLNIFAINYLYYFKEMNQTQFKFIKKYNLKHIILRNMSM